MATLWTFGDSMTAGDGCLLHLGIRDGGDKYYNEYKELDSDIWPNILGRTIGLNVKNIGKSGASNDYILDSIIDKLAENDNVIVVSHGDIIKLAIAKILGLQIDNFQKLVIDPASISIVKVENSEDKEHSRRTALISMNESGTPLSKLLENKELAGLGGGKGDGGGA